MREDDIICKLQYLGKNAQIVRTSAFTKAESPFGKSWRRMPMRVIDLCFAALKSLFDCLTSLAQRQTFCFLETHGKVRKVIRYTVIDNQMTV